MATRNAKKDEGSGFVRVLSVLIGGALSLGIVLGAINFVVMPMLNNMSANMGMPAVTAVFHPAADWKETGKVSHQAGFTCDDKDHSCPSETRTYTTTKLVTPAQLQASIMGSKAPVQGDCQHAQPGQPLCTMHYHGSTGYDYDSTVTQTGGNYTITLSAYPSAKK